MVLASGCCDPSRCAGVLARLREQCLLPGRRPILLAVDEDALVSGVEEWRSGGVEAMLQLGDKRQWR